MFLLMGDSGGDLDLETGFRNHPSLGSPLPAIPEDKVLKEPYTLQQFLTFFDALFSVKKLIQLADWIYEDGLATAQVLALVLKDAAKAPVPSEQCIPSSIDMQTMKTECVHPSLTALPKHPRRVKKRRRGRRRRFQRPDEISDESLGQTLFFDI